MKFLAALFIMTGSVLIAIATEWYVPIAIIFIIIGAEISKETGREAGRDE